MTTSTSGGVVSAVHWVLKDPTADRNLSATLSNVAPRGIRLLPDGVRAGMTELIKTELGRALGTDMGAALVAGWRSYRRLVNEAQRSRTMAGQALIVALNPFETTWKQTATVAVRSSRHHSAMFSGRSQRSWYSNFVSRISVPRSRMDT